ncbi:hypothetical protein KDJ56_10995 [Brevibacillus composti]|uniref:Uncharacterized protein n=1 Tax=Brevibacillus composti TaxID=2796470 RepID=A0ABX7Z8J0_9BACL|nr:hypothetical protein [Brevibacillus composti]QUO43427.1 hypothetical protein KDJ56_10995 [Brevibacillus composti]
MSERKKFDDEVTETLSALMSCIREKAKRSSSEDLKVLPELVQATAELIKAIRD